jgi:hypothetical protein
MFLEKDPGGTLPHWLTHWETNILSTLAPTPHP